MSETQRATLVDGPWAGQNPRLVPSSSGWWSPTYCRKKPGGEWQHYDYTGDGIYRYAGTCASVGCEVVELCTYTWYDDQPHDGRHRCDQLGEHGTHRCCCGALRTV